jgi:hypothetical protein
MPESVASRCPDDETLAALVDGTLAGAERSALEAHAVECAACREALGLAARALDAAADAAAAPGAAAGPSEAALARARGALEGSAGGAAPPPLAAPAPLAASPASASPAAAPLSGAAPASAGPGGRVLRMRSPWAAAAAAALLLAAAGVARVLFHGDGTTSDGTGATLAGASSGAGAPLEEGAAVVASVAGAIEVRAPGTNEWRPLSEGDVIAPETELRLEPEGDGEAPPPENGRRRRPRGEERPGDAEVAALTLDGGAGIAFRRGARATFRPGRHGLEIALERGGLAVSTPPGGGRPIRVATPQGGVSAGDGLFEVHVRRGGALVIAREGAGLACETGEGGVHLSEGEHTLLLDGRPPKPPRRGSASFRRGGRDRDHDRGERGDRDRDGPCPGGPPRLRAPGGPELDSLFKEGEGPT